MEAILYTFAVKFLDDDELKSIKEAIAMTKLGQGCLSWQGSSARVRSYLSGITGK